ncbi:MAG: hypothetical protein ACKOFI_05120, partial [Phycisphaerales bacterium]
RVHATRHLVNDDLAAVVDAVEEAWAHRGEEDGEIVIASVNDPVAIEVETKVAAAQDRRGRAVSSPPRECPRTTSRRGDHRRERGDRRGDGGRAGAPRA